MEVTPRGVSTGGATKYQRKRSTTPCGFKCHACFRLSIGLNPLLRVFLAHFSRECSRYISRSPLIIRSAIFTEYKTTKHAPSPPSAGGEGGERRQPNHPRAHHRFAGPSIPAPCP